MGRFISALAAALLISAVSLLGQAITPQGEAAARNLTQDLQTEGCIRLWKPQPVDPTKMPNERQPGLAGVYLLTPLSAGSMRGVDLPTYLLTPSGTISYSQHVGHKVQITGIAQTAPLPPTVQEIAGPPPMRPEEKPTTNGMPRLTVTTMKMVSESCP